MDPNFLFFDDVNVDMWHWSGFLKPPTLADNVKLWRELKLRQISNY